MLQKLSDAYDKKIGLYQGKLKQIDVDIKFLEDKITKHRHEVKETQVKKVISSLLFTQESSDVVIKQIKQAEKQLDVLRIKRNETIAKNKQLRDLINKIRKDKMVYHKINDKLEKELEEKKGKMKEQYENVRNIMIKKVDEDTKLKEKNKDKQV